MNTRLGAGRRTRPRFRWLFAVCIFIVPIVRAQVLEATIRLPGDPRLLVQSFGDKLYVRNQQFISTDSVALYVIDCTSDSLVGTIRLGVSGMNFPAYAELDGRRDLLYYSTPESGHVAVIDLRADSVIATLKFSGATWGMAYDSRHDRLYVCSHRICAVDCTTRVTTDSLPLLGEFFAVWDSMDNKLYTGGGFGSDVVRVIDCETFTVLTTLYTLLGPSIDRVAYSPAFNRLCLGHVGDYTGGVINCSTDVYTYLPGIGSVMYAAVCNDAEGKAYWPTMLPGNYSDSLTVTDLRGDSVLRRIQLKWRGGLCQTYGGIGLARWSNRLYVAWGATDSSGAFHSLLSAMDCATDSIIGTVELPTHPAIGLFCNAYDHRIYVIGYPPDSNVYVYRDEPAGGVETPVAITPAVSFSVAPNPASGSVIVFAQAPAVDIYDAAGRLVRRLALNSGRATLSGLEPGVYVLRAGTASAKLTVTD
jgi:hypothetical protein